MAGDACGVVGGRTEGSAVPVRTGGTGGDMGPKVKHWLKQKPAQPISHDLTRSMPTANIELLPWNMPSTEAAPVLLST